MTNNKQTSSKSKNEGKIKRTREASLQTDDDEVFKDCHKCKSTDARLTARLLKLIPELEIYGNRIKSLEEEPEKHIQESLQSSQVEVKEVKDLQEKVSKQQESIEASVQHVECELGLITVFDAILTSRQTGLN